MKGICECKLMAGIFHAHCQEPDGGKVIAREDFENEWASLYTCPDPSCKKCRVGDRLRKMFIDLFSERDEALKRIEDFKRHVIPCVICEYKEGVLITRCWLHEKLEEEILWKKAYRAVAVQIWKTGRREYEKTITDKPYSPLEIINESVSYVDDNAKILFEEGK